MTHVARARLWQDTSWLSRNRLLLGALLCALVLSFIFRDAISVILQSWSRDEYSHGYLIPVIGLVLLANNLSDARLAPTNSQTGLAIVVLCIALSAVCAALSVESITPVLYLMALGGLVILFWGVEAAPLLVAPMALGLLALPQPVPIYNDLSFNMRLLSTTLGVGLLRALGIPVVQDGNIIDLGIYQLQVADACSGLRYLFPLISLSFLLAYLYKAPLWKRALVFGSSLPLSILMNGLRIGVIGITVALWGPRLADGVLHDFEGWVVFLGCVVLLIGEVQILQLIGRKNELDFSSLRIPSLSRLPMPVFGKLAQIGGALLVVTLAVTFLLPSRFSDSVTPVRLRQPFALFPLALGPWTGRFEALPPASLAILGTGDYLLADYEKPGAAPVNLYVLYYPFQNNGSVVAHSPSVCIPGGGWSILSQARKTVAVGGPMALEVNELVIEKGSARRIVYFWFNQGGHAVASPVASRLYRIRNAVSTGTTNGAMIRVTTALRSQETQADAESRLLLFLRDGLRPVNSFMFPSQEEDGEINTSVPQADVRTTKAREANERRNDYQRD